MRSGKWPNRAPILPEESSERRSQPEITELNVQRTLQEARFEALENT